MDEVPPRWHGGEAEQAADGLWSRFRDITMALNRIQSFNFAVESGEGRFTDRWLEGLLKDEGVLANVGQELVLRAFRCGADAINFKILTSLREEEAVALSRLAQVTGLFHFTLSERVNDLVQVGLAVRVLEEDAVRATPLTRGFLGIVGEIERRLTAKIRAELPGLIAP
jgi:hypothetical protein